MGTDKNGMRTKMRRGLIGKTNKNGTKMVCGQNRDADKIGIQTKMGCGQKRDACNVGKVRGGVKEITSTIISLKKKKMKREQEWS